MFVIDDADARLRDPADLARFLTDATGAPQTIAFGTQIKVTDVKAVPRGSRSVLCYARVTRADNGAEFGWTAASNVKGGLLSETIGTIAAPANGSRFGPHAAWENGVYKGQIDLVRIIGTKNELEYLAGPIAAKFVALVAAARADGIVIGVNSGFRSYPEQKMLRENWERRVNGFAPANRPGHSNHQNGIAFDLDVGVGPGNPVYDWLAAHATGLGVLRTVPPEVWHWEYRPQQAAQAKAAGRHTSW